MEGAHHRPGGEQDGERGTLEARWALMRKDSVRLGSQFRER